MTQSATLSQTPQQNLPRVGMVATVRNRRGIITALEPYFAGIDGTLHLLRINNTDIDGVPNKQLLWEHKPHKSLVAPHTLPKVLGDSPINPRKYDAFRDQWQQEMNDKFSLGFDIVDRDEIYVIKKRQGMDAGSWRIDKNKDPELRHIVFVQVAFQDLTKLVAHYGGERDRAIAVFCGMASDAQVGNSDALRQAVLHVAPTDGSRFYDWQLAQDPDESWEECRRHAEL